MFWPPPGHCRRLLEFLVSTRQRFGAAGSNTEFSSPYPPCKLKDRPSTILAISKALVSASRIYPCNFSILDNPFSGHGLCLISCVRPSGAGARQGGFCIGERRNDEGAHERRHCAAPDSESVRDEGYGNMKWGISVEDRSSAPGFAAGITRIC